MTHVNHASLEGYDPSQLLVDGCDECEQRGSDVVTAILHMDGQRFRMAWARAAAWQTDSPGIGPTVAVCEAPMLRSLWAVEVMFERLFNVPLGEIPPGLMLYR